MTKTLPFSPGKMELFSKPHASAAACLPNTQPPNKSWKSANGFGNSDGGESGHFWFLSTKYQQMAPLGTSVSFP